MNKVITNLVPKIDLPAIWDLCFCNEVKTKLAPHLLHVDKGSFLSIDGDTIKQSLISVTETLTWSDRGKISADSSFWIVFSTSAPSNSKSDDITINN